MVFLSLASFFEQFFTSHTIGTIGLLQPYPAPHFKAFQVFLIYFPKCPSFSTIQIYVPNVALMLVSVVYA